MNHCKWLMIGSTTRCNKLCRSEFCGYYLQSVRRGSFDPTPCLICHVGVRGKSQLCLNCGEKRYRDLKRYYDKRIKNAVIDPSDGSVGDKIIKTPQDYIERFILKANNELTNSIVIQMSQDFRPHPVLVNYEASRDGVMRHRRLKKPVGSVNNMGYMMFTAGKKRYLFHRAINEAFYGLIEDGFVIDHIDGFPQNNKLDNLRVVTQRQNSKLGGTGKRSKKAKHVKSFITKTNEEKIFQSINEARSHFDICGTSFRFVAENITKTALSMKNGHKIKFSYIKGDNSYNDMILA